MTPRMILHEFFEMQADARPNASAVLYDRVAVTYADLERLANRYARHLRGFGIGRGCIVAMLVPRSIDAYASILGILKSGAAYLPIDPEYPSDRIEYMLENSSADALVTTV